MSGRRGSVKRTKRNDNPYINNTGEELDDFRNRMRQVIDLYFYMTFPHQAGFESRPKHQPFRMNTLSYIRSTMPKKVKKKLKGGESASPAFANCPLTEHIPSVVFLRLKNDQMVDCRKAYIHCFQVREIDGFFSATQSVARSSFEAALDSDLKVNIDLVGMKPIKMNDCDVKNEYLVVKVKFVTDSMNVSGGRRLRSVPARVHAHLDDAPEGTSRIMLAAKKISTMHREWEGHKVKQGRAVLALIPQDNLGIDGDSMEWQKDEKLVSKVLAEARKPEQHPSITVNIIVDPKGDMLSDTEDEEEQNEAEEEAKPSTSKEVKVKVEEEEPFELNKQPPPEVWVHQKNPEVSIGTPLGLLDIIEPGLRDRWLNEKMPKILAWCFRMTEEPYDVETDLPETSLAAAIAAAEAAPPADVFKFTKGDCFLCKQKRNFTLFTSFLFHLSTCHDRLKFEFKEKLLKTPQHLLIKKKKPDEWCHGLIVSLNRKFDGSHEYDLTRHYRKNLHKKGGLVKVPDAWNQPPCFIVVKSIAKVLRETPPATSVNNYLFNSKFNFGNFGITQTELDRHFQTSEYAQAYKPYTVMYQNKRIEEYIDLNDNEKALLKLLNDFSCTFRCLHQPRMTFGMMRVLISEKRETLLDHKMYFQFNIHLCSLLNWKRINLSEYYDIIARLKDGPSYDPRTDPKHIVHQQLKSLELQRSCPNLSKRRRLASRNSQDSIGEVVRENTEPPRSTVDKLKESETKTQSEPPKSPPILEATKGLKRKSVETPEEVLMSLVDQPSTSGLGNKRAFRRDEDEPSTSKEFQNEATSSRNVDKGPTGTKKSDKRPESSKNYKEDNTTSSSANNDKNKASSSSKTKEKIFSSSNGSGKSKKQDDLDVNNGKKKANSFKNSSESCKSDKIPDGSINAKSKTADGRANHLEVPTPNDKKPSESAKNSGKNSKSPLGSTKSFNNSTKSGTSANGSTKSNISSNGSAKNNISPNSSAKSNLSPNGSTKNNINPSPSQRSERRNSTSSKRSSISDSTNKNVPVARVGPFDKIIKIEEGDEGKDEQGAEINGGQDVAMNDANVSNDKAKLTVKQVDTLDEKMECEERQADDGNLADVSRDNSREDLESESEKEEDAPRTFRNTEQRVINTTLGKKFLKRLIKREEAQAMEPSEVVINSFEDLEQRYPFANHSRLKMVWHFMREWTRETVDWK
ncbi:unnamed protein product [Bursaphelenchus okinawaensis]|uniref:Polycomb protein VEFS-Box domain-containing protein n=1 Tax=Bursaphelenchus okinawaensis TaxID=465554 RepID=A0A811LCJ7_9BILA|nr:unnamed protein product [Bursaphelenchus okinawaensis]CAG9120616.1 unnamed protein product [Bursaphelenchus okinawaensis]